ncbi:MAG TPA: hypothetical protein PK347_10260 [Burkholderiaceae bacterium]|nr:hypothetical protein [Burkholderiaceae bacterium]
MISLEKNGFTKVFLGTLCVLACSLAHANTAVCKGRGFIDSVYQNGLGGTDYEYMVIVRNQTSTPMKLQLAFRGFPNTVTLFSPTLPGITLSAHGSQTIRFGKGTNGNISMGTVAVLYDGEVAAGRPAVVMSQCTSG